MNSIIPITLLCLTLSACGEAEKKEAPEVTAATSPLPNEEATPLPPAPVSTAPDCASSEASDAIAEVAMSNEWNKLDVQLLKNPSPAPEGEDSAEWSRVRGEQWAEMRLTAVYSFENVRTRAKDDTLKNSTCAADLKMEVENYGGATIPITYKLETTSEGDLYASVNGL